jgi:hypothetical protein
MQKTGVELDLFAEDLSLDALAVEALPEMSAAGFNCAGSFGTAGCFSSSCKGTAGTFSCATGG